MSNQRVFLYRSGSPAVSPLQLHIVELIIGDTLDVQACEGICPQGIGLDHYYFFSTVSRQLSDNLQNKIRGLLAAAELQTHRLTFAHVVDTSQKDARPPGEGIQIIGEFKAFLQVPEKKKKKK